MIKAQRKLTPLRLETLENRRVMAAAAFDLQFFSDDNGSPGDLISDSVVEQGDSFFLRITAQEFNPYRFGLVSASVDVDWDASLLEVVETDLSSTITDHLPAFRSGELNNDAGSIDDLSGTAISSLGAGRAIGNAHAETFAMIQMQAADLTGSAAIRLSESQIRTIISPSAELTGDQLRFAEASLTIVENSEPFLESCFPEVTNSKETQSDTGSSDDTTASALDSIRSASDNAWSDSTDIAKELGEIRGQPSEADRANQAASLLGIYAVPCRIAGVNYWRPRLPNGHDPDLGWYLESQPTIKGWPTWAAAVNDLADHLGLQESSI